MCRLVSARGRDIPPPDINAKLDLQPPFCWHKIGLTVPGPVDIPPPVGKLGKNPSQSADRNDVESKNPRCFRFGRPLVHYFNNDTAWSNSETLYKWFNSAFVPHILSCTSNKVALLVDNASSNSNLYDIREQVVVIPLPPNVSSVHQPVDMVHHSR